MNNNLINENNPASGLTGMTQPPEIHELKVPATLRHIEKVKQFVTEIAEKIGFNSLDMFQIELVVDEAYANAADHGSECSKEKEVHVKCIVDGNKLILIIKDFGGKPFNPDFFERIADKKTWGIGGRGIKIIKEIMDEVMYFFVTGKSTTLYMVKEKKEETNSENGGEPMAAPQINFGFSLDDIPPIPE